MSKKDTKFSMSLDDGRIVFRNEQVDKQINFYPVPDDVAVMVDKGNINWKVVKEACEKKMKEKGELSIQDYLQKLKLLNVRRTKVEVKDDVPKVEDRSDEMISLSDVIPEKKESSPSKKVVRSESKSKAKPAVEVNFG